MALPGLDPSIEQHLALARLLGTPEPPENQHYALFDVDERRVVHRVGITGGVPAA